MTCSKAIKSLRDLKNINYITLHANAGEEAVKAVIKTAKKIFKNNLIAMLSLIMDQCI